jgi:hypothetical protein
MSPVVSVMFPLVVDLISALPEMVTLLAPLIGRSNKIEAFPVSGAVIARVDVPKSIAVGLEPSRELFRFVNRLAIIVLPIFDSVPASRVDRERISNAETWSIAPRILTPPPMASVIGPVARRVSDALLVGLTAPLTDPLTLMLWVWMVWI